MKGATVRHEGLVCGIRRVGRVVSPRWLAISAEQACICVFDSDWVDRGRAIGVAVREMLCNSLWTESHDYVVVLMAKGRSREDF